MVGDVAARKRPEHGAERDPAGHDLERDRADRERLLDAEEGARDDALVVAEEGAGQQNDREDARGAGEGKTIGDCNPGVGQTDRRWELLVALRRVVSAMPPLLLALQPVKSYSRSKRPTDDAPIFVETSPQALLTEIDRRSNAQHKRIAIRRGRIPARTDDVLRVEF